MEKVNYKYQLNAQMVYICTLRFSSASVYGKALISPTGERGPKAQGSTGEQLCA